MAQTRPTGEQLRFLSAKTGEHILDAYMENVEQGSRTLGDMIQDLWDSSTGALRADLWSLRLDPTDNTLQQRIGDYLDPEDGWFAVENASFFNTRGEHAAATDYLRLDLVSYNDTIYLCNTAHTSAGAIPNGTFFSPVVDLSASGVSSFNGRTGSVTLTLGDLTGVLGYVPADPATPSFTGPLTIEATSALPLLTVRDPNAGPQDLALFSTTGTANGDEARIYLSASDTLTRSGYIGGLNIQSGAAKEHALTFGTSAPAAQPVERMRISHLGVSIGKTAPFGLLDVAGDIVLSGDLKGHDGSTYQSLAINAADLDFKIGGNSKMTLNSSGQLYINGSITTSNAALQVNGFMRTGNIFIHTGGLNPVADSNAKALDNVAGTLRWDGDPISLQGHTHAIADTTGLQTSLDTLQTNIDGKLSLTGGTVTGNIEVSTSGSTGSVRLVSGTVTNTGYVGFHDATGTRAGYIGYGDGSSVALNAEGGRHISFNMVPRVNGTPVELTGHTHDYLPLTGGSLTGSLSVGSGLNVQGFSTFTEGGGAGFSAAGFTGNLVVESDGSVGISILTANNTQSAMVAFGDPENSTVGRVQYDHASDAMVLRANDALIFNRAGTNKGLWNNDGLAIGHIVPTNPIHTVSSSWTHALFEGTGTKSQLAFKDSAATGGNYDVGIGSDGDKLVLRTSNTGRLFIDSAGNVGINASVPTQKLHVAGDALVANGADSRIYLNDTASGMIQFASSQMRVAALGANSIGFWANGFERLSVMSTGRVGIGTSAPDALLEVLNGGHADVFINTLNTARRSELILQEVSGNTGMVQWRGTTVASDPNQMWVGTSIAANLSLVTNNARRLTILPSGYVGIAKDVPTEPLDVTGNIQTSGVIKMTSVAGRTKLRLWAGDTYGVGMETGWTFGSLNGDYAITFQNNTGAARGFWWGASTHTTAQGVMALNMSGQLTVAASIRVGYGTSDTTLHGSADLDVAGTATVEGGIEVGYRKIPKSGTVSGTLTASHVGYCLPATGGITVPNAVFAAGDAVSIYNNSASSITITQGASLTLRLAGTTTTGSRTLAPRGMATIWFNASNEAIISGAGVS